MDDAQQASMSVFVELMWLQKRSYIENTAVVCP
jgi:hypothetical protein